MTSKRLYLSGRARAASVAGLVAVLALASASTVFAAGGPLVGTFEIAPGANSGGGEAGSYFRMIEPGGTATSGPFLSNISSSATDQTYTLLSPGTDGGLTAGAYEPEPSPAFDASGNSLASLLIQPTPFFGVNFSADTAATDPQTALAVPAPSISTDGSGNLSGNLSAWGASWNNQEFNQGSPKPNGESPGLTAGPSGTYNAVTGAYTLNWTSAIVGGPFNGFTGEWHLPGTFVPLPTVSAVSPSSGAANGGTTVTITGTGLGSASAVDFGSTAAKVTADSATSITATAPAGSGTVDVTVTTAGGTSVTSSADHYTYVAPTVTAIYPNQGPVSGWNLVWIVGKNLGGVTAVKFGSTPAPAFAPLGAGAVLALAPAGSPGAVDVTVTTTGGKSATSSADRYVYVKGLPLGGFPF